MHAVSCVELVPNIPEDDWTMVLPRTKLGPHRQHQFQLENVGRPYTHVRVTIYPDGGIKRVRIFGRRVGEGSSGIQTQEEQVALLREYCKCFDTISLCFSKGLGAPIGSIVVFSSPELRERARHVRKSIGGGLRQAGVVSAAARVSVEDTFLGGKLRACHERAKKVRDMWESMGGKVVNPVETNMAWIDIEAAGISKADFIALGQKAGLRFMGGRLVCHYQIGDEAVQRLSRVFEAVLKRENLEANGGVEDLAVEKLAGSVNVAR